MLLIDASSNISTICKVLVFWKAVITIMEQIWSMRGKSNAEMFVTRKNDDEMNRNQIKIHIQQVKRKQPILHIFLHTTKALSVDRQDRSMRLHTRNLLKGWLKKYIPSSLLKSI